MSSDRLDVLLDHAALHAKVAEIARRIEDDCGDEPVLLVGVLKGAIHFLSDLARNLRIDSRIDFIQTSSYGSGKSSTGIVQIRKDLDINIENLNVIIVEDIVDTGHTLAYLRELLATRRPKSLRVAALLSKPAARLVHPPVEYIGYEIPNEFVVGYGLDYAEKYRNLPYIAILREG
jgi:hypoxanthine phosphoribosyltransferase